MPTDQKVQELVHRIEEGRWAKWVQLTAFLAVMVAMFTAFILDPWYWGLYKGLSHPKAMDQAQIARELARGNGFATKMVRPLAFTQIKTNKGVFDPSRMPDTYHAPLWSMTLAPFLKAVKIWPECVPGSWRPFHLPTFHAPVKDRWQLSTREYIYVCDRMVSAVAMIFFFLTVLVSYFTVRRLFDHHIGMWTVVSMLGCNLYWQYSLSGLPQMLMSFLFGCALYALVRAVEIRQKERWPYGWLALMTALFGLLALTHGIAVWIFGGAFLFCVVYFKPRWRTAALMAGVFLLAYSPWVYRNYRASGTPFGVSAMCALEQIKGTENAIMRTLEPDTRGLSPTTFRKKIQTQLSVQLGSLFSSLGGILAAPVFFLALLHLFKTPLARTFRWALLSMWIPAVVGMSALTMYEEGAALASYNLHILFIPTFVGFGIAFIFVLWMRLEIDMPVFRYAFFTLLFAISTLPLVNYMTTGNKSPVQWPPYSPPHIALLREWTQPEEVIASDMPWAVAWYADRKSLWLPMTIQAFLDFNDYEHVGAKIAGIYLTPISGNKPLVSEIVKGDYKDWAPFILRNVNTKDFPLKSVTAMPLDYQCIFYSDRDRWTDKMD